MNCFSLSSKDGSAGGCMTTAACAGRGDRPPLRGPGRPPWGRADPGRLRAFLLGLGLLDGQIDFPSGETERIFTVTSCPSVR